MQIPNFIQRILSSMLYFIAVVGFVVAMSVAGDFADRQSGIIRTYGQDDVGTFSLDLRSQGVPDDIAARMTDSLRTEGVQVTSFGGAQYNTYAQIKGIAQIIISIGLLLLANWLVVRADAITKIRVIDHFRQSAGFYALLLVSWLVMMSGFNAPIIFLAQVIAVSAIGANVLFLIFQRFWRKKQKVIINPSH